MWPTVEPMMFLPRRRPWLLALSVLTLLLAACGGEDEELTGGVASVSDLADADAVDAADALQAATDQASTLSAEEAGLALSACMRDAGYNNFPDATVDANGRLNLRGALESSDIDLRDEEVRAQLDTCRDDVGADNFGAAGRGGDRDGIEEALLGYTECLRAEGLDVGDVTLGQPNGGATDGGQGEGQGQPRGEGGAGGDRGGRIAGQLGLDVDDPATAAALEACQGALDEAFVGIGGPGGGAPATTDS